ncbi:CcoQ/FixQ family Cbb3-type cytochrome c oxidase assembly chaperone [Blattabacterium cuenoti]|nr:CcoQ/FixQ family Cbb3-type cytochrome c oxidase assembly chaperone [Blattabacterium cuenoti]
MISFFKKYFTEEKNVGIFQSIMLILFLLVFFFILFFVFSKPKKYYEEISLIPLEGEKKRKGYEI